MFILSNETYDDNGQKHKEREEQNIMNSLIRLPVTGLFASNAVVMGFFEFTVI